MAPSTSLEEKYSHLYFLLNLSQSKRKKTKQQAASRSFAAEFFKLPLEKLEAIYSYGAHPFSANAFILKWLQENDEREWIILEDDLEGIRFLLNEKKMRELLENPRVYLYLLGDQDQLDQSVNEIAQLHAKKCIEMVYFSKDERDFARLREAFLRKSAVHHALFLEDLLQDRLAENLIANLKHWPRSILVETNSNLFAGKPAIICGAGPSLKEAVPTLKKMQRSALILAGGSTISALQYQGIEPHIAMAMDPNPEEYHRLKTITSMNAPLIYALRLHPEALNSYGGRLGYYQTFSGGALEYYFEQKAGLKAAKPPKMGQEAMSVTTSLISFAQAMGMNPIVFVGMDLCFHKEKMYADGVFPTEGVEQEHFKADPRSSEKLVKQKNHKGQEVFTLIKWIMESEVISSFAKAHPQTTFYNATMNGLGFESIKTRALDNFLQEWRNEYDFASLVHTWFESSAKPFTFAKVQQFLTELLQSFQEASEILKRILSELKGKTPHQGRLMVDEFDLKELQAYSIALANHEYAIKKQKNTNNLVFYEKLNKINDNYIKIIENNL